MEHKFVLVKKNNRGYYIIKPGKIYKFVPSKNKGIHERFSLYKKEFITIAITNEIEKRRNNNRDEYFSIFPGGKEFVINGRNGIYNDPVFYDVYEVLCEK